MLPTNVSIFDAHRVTLCVVVIMDTSPHVMLCDVSNYFSFVCVMVIHRVMPHIFTIYQLLNVPTAQTVRGSQSAAADDAVPSGSSKTSGGVLRSVIIAPPSDQPRDAASSASGMRKGMLSISSHFSHCILSIPSVTANIE